MALRLYIEVGCGSAAAETRIKNDWKRIFAFANKTLDVRYWHLADIFVCIAHVRFRS